VRENEGNDGRVTRATMVTVAEAAGVSLKTVSRVINGEPGVRPDTVEKVRAASAALRYERNDLAASLRHGARSYTVGLIIEDVANPFYSAIAQAVEESARVRASLLITASAREDPARERELVTALLRRRVDALLIVPAGTDHRYVRDSFDTKIVFVDRPPAKTKADTVLGDNAAGARRAVEHLLSAGHERIAFIGDDLALYTASERLAGYRQALTTAGIDVDDALVATGNGTSAAARSAARAMLTLSRVRRPTAIFTGNNRCTVGVLHALEGRRPRVALVGFDDFELADLLGLTVVRTDSYRVGQLAAELAFGRIDGDDRAPRRIVVPSELVTRGSGEIPA
jgi:LacI family transcriptional regulator